MKIFLIIAASTLAFLLLIIALILFCKISVYFVYNKDISDNLIIKVKFLFLTFNLQKTKSKKQDKKKKNKAEEKKVTSKDNDIFGLSFEKIIEIIKAVFDKFLNKFYFKKLDLEIVIASDNAASTAMYYGMVNASVYPLIGLLDSTDKVKDIHVDIRPDFTSEKAGFCIDVIIQTRIIYAIQTIIYLIKNKIIF